jgi:uncharacterized protein YndB with AHSA1/START domain
MNQPNMDSPNSPTQTLVIEKEMPHPPEKIWRALTQAALIDQWLMSNNFQPVVGHKFTLRAPPQPKWNGIINCEVLIVERHQKLSYRWGALGQDTVVTLILTPTKDGTLVRMEHAGFRPDQEANYKGASYGWQKFLGGLERVVAELQ